MSRKGAGTVVITGASSGIGRSLAMEFARRGYSLGLLARRWSLLEQVSRDCLNNGSPRVEWLPVDVTDSKRLRQTLQDKSFYLMMNF